MARLQRKKSAQEKKKKKQLASQAGGEGDAIAANAGSSAAAVIKDPGKKKVQQKKPTGAAKAASGGIVGYWNTSMQFLREVKVELKKVTWPSRKQTVGSTVVVIVLVTIIAFFLSVADIGLSSLIQVVLQ